jgi:hypothetical protein
MLLQHLDLPLQHHVEGVDLLPLAVGVAAKIEAPYLALFEEAELLGALEAGQHRQLEEVQLLEDEFCLEADPVEGDVFLRGEVGCHLFEREPFLQLHLLAGVFPPGEDRAAGDVEVAQLELIGAGGRNEDDLDVLLEEFPEEGEVVVLEEFFEVGEGLEAGAVDALDDRVGSSYHFRSIL